MPHVDVIRFGIPSVDELFGPPHNRLDNSGGPEASTSNYGLAVAGIHLPSRKISFRNSAPGASKTSGALPPSSVSICITGPGGTGKSILGMHLASRYLADCRDTGNRSVKVLYVSTDLKFEVANSVWQRFGLTSPNKRAIPFMEHPIARGKANHRVDLVQCHPLQSPEEKKGAYPLSSYLVKANIPETEVYFIDLASDTAGDDWGFVSRVLSVIERDDEELPHLMIIDSVEGFETLVGERDAFGESQPRRSRVAQILRAAGDKCHIVFIVEEAKEGEHLPEEFVTDVVIRLRSLVFKDYGRRTIEIVKTRGQAHVRGQHIVLIRSGSGSTTGNWANHDDPEVPSLVGSSQQSYVHVCASLHYLNRKVMSQRGRGLPPNEPLRYSAFGIRYLDEMLAAKIDDFKRRSGDDQRGLLCRTTTALIGNSQTQKSPMGYAFLGRCFRTYAEELSNEITRLERHPKEVKRLLGRGDALDGAGKPSSAIRNWERLIWNRLTGKDSTKKIPLVKDAVVLAAALSLGPPREMRDGLPVLLTTQDVHTESLVEEFLPWLLRKVPALGGRGPDGQYNDRVKALKVLMEERTICRRLEIHDMPSAVLIHIVQRSLQQAQRFLFNDDVPESSESRFHRSWGIRVVLDDLSVIRHTYAEVRDDSLFLRYLIFMLGREGVTTLLVDTQEGHPHLTIPSSFDSELRSLVSNHIYTWRFPFYDTNRVAIAAIPPMRPQARTVIRELRQGLKDNRGYEGTPLIVDPHFELYSGIETGQPKPIPLVIRLYEELPAFKEYIEAQNSRFCDVFTPLNEGNGGKIIVGVRAEGYQQLFELASIQKETLLDHALVFQVDEFWTMKRPVVRRSGASRPMWDYLHAKTRIETTISSSKKSEPIWEVDGRGFYQKTLVDDETLPGNLVDDLTSHPETPFRRSDTFVSQGYELMDASHKELIDRVPFMWDFGFLLCKIHPWEDTHNKNLPLRFLQESNPEREGFETVEAVWNSMILATKDGATRTGKRASWRVFLEACFHLAKAQAYSTSSPVQAFDLYISAIPGFSCLILEIWASEIYKYASEKDRDRLRKVARRGWEDPQEGLIEWLTAYPEQLFRTWLLLVEVLDLRNLASAITEHRLGEREPNPNSLAVRHWYKTACAFTQNLPVEDPVVPVGLPGNFSIRGDWFLAVAGGGRSDLLADRALDFLTTRRANYERLRSGLGLPVRRIVTDHLRTGIFTLDTGEQDKKEDTRRRVSQVHYENLIRLGGPTDRFASSSSDDARDKFEPEDFHWLWRSRLAHFSHHTKIWHDWLYQTIVWWNRMRETNDEEWMNGFQRYDEMVNPAKGDEKKDIRSWKLFQKRRTHLIQQLKGATLSP